MKEKKRRKISVLIVVIVILAILLAFALLTLTQFKKPARKAAVWYFDENTGSVAYDKINKNNGIVHGASWVEGKSNSALLFDGIDDWVEVKDSASLDISNAITIATWVKPFSLSGPNADDYFIIVFKGYWKWWEPTTETNYELYLMNSSEHPNSIWFEFLDDKEFHYVGKNNVIEENKWYHIVGTYNGSVMRIYLDGVLIDSKEVVTSLVTNNHTLTIGQVDNNFYFNGIIDEVAIYNRALSAKEVYDLYLKNEQK